MSSRLIALLLFLSAYSAWLLIRAAKTRHWPATRAVATSTEPASGWSIAALPWDGAPDADFHAAYKVRIRYEAEGASREAAVRLESPPESTLTIYYDPTEPTRVVLRPGVHAFHFWPAILALLILIAYFTLRLLAE